MSLTEKTKSILATIGLVLGVPLTLWLGVLWLENRFVSERSLDDRFNLQAMHREQLKQQFEHLSSNLNEKINNLTANQSIQRQRFLAVMVSHGPVIHSRIQELNVSRIALEQDPEADPRDLVAVRSRIELLNQLYASVISGAQ
jgi:1,4-alpha-glucan branching enzyme